MRKNKGAPGIVGVTIAKFETRLDDELSRLTVELESWTYEPSPARRVEIPKPAERVMASIGGYIEKRLKRVVNRDRSQGARSDRVKFLGLTMVGDTIAISRKALQAAMDKVNELTPRGTHLALETSVERINNWYLGWSSYFAMTYYPAQLKKIEAHLRRRLRAHGRGGPGNRGGEEGRRTRDPESRLT